LNGSFESAEVFLKTGAFNDRCLWRGGGPNVFTNEADEFDVIHFMSLLGAI
jgi:hypothetical protein